MSVHFHTTGTEDDSHSTLFTLRTSCTWNPIITSFTLLTTGTSRTRKTRFTWKIIDIFILTMTFFSLKKNFTFSFAPTETKQILHDDFSVTFHWVYFWIKSVWDRDQVLKILTQLIIMNLCEFRMQELQRRLVNSTVHCPVRWCVLQAKNWAQKIPVSKMLLYS